MVFGGVKITNLIVCSIGASSGRDLDPARLKALQHLDCISPFGKIKGWRKGELSLS